MRKRSKYRPKGVILNPVEYVLTGLKPMPEVSETVPLRIKNHDALNEVRMGRATRDHISILIAALNMTEGLAYLKLGDQYESEIRGAQDALFAVAQRGAMSGRFVLTGPELQALNLGMEIHDAQLDAATVRDVEHALAYVRKIISSKRARKITGGPSNT